MKGRRALTGAESADEGPFGEARTRKKAMAPEAWKSTRHCMHAEIAGVEVATGGSGNRRRPPAFGQTATAVAPHSTTSCGTAGQKDPLVPPTIIGRGVEPRETPKPSVVLAATGARQCADRRRRRQISDGSVVTHQRLRYFSDPSTPAATHSSFRILFRCAGSLRVGIDELQPREGKLAQNKARGHLGVRATQVWRYEGEVDRPRAARRKTMGSRHRHGVAVSSIWVPMRHHLLPNKCPVLSRSSRLRSFGPMSPPRGRGCTGSPTIYRPLGGSFSLSRPLVSSLSLIIIRFYRSLRRSHSPLSL
ncbi:hypothetical protein B296_00017907 [Ensete ventricosum]|uniref:Uncharacterized protein n=1 Tax=Ensete ventricosum TaxID=4639 RepID=A0A427A646_ENSVE|nr:hypothetical protein B296_00017907 [Ensete ventricosum]